MHSDSHTSSPFSSPFNEIFLHIVDDLAQSEVSVPLRISGGHQEFFILGWHFSFRASDCEEPPLVCITKDGQDCLLPLFLLSDRSTLEARTAHFSQEDRLNLQNVLMAHQSYIVSQFRKYMGETQNRDRSRPVSWA